MEVAVQPRAAAAEFNSSEFREALGTFATGVTVITTRGEEEPYGMTANAFSSVSLDPPLVLICVISGTTGAEMIERNGVFAVNILAADQEPLSRYFASKERPRGRHAFREIPHSDGVTGSPLLDGTAGHLECRLAARHEVGDHVIYIGEVLSLQTSSTVHPLVFHRGRYCFIREDG